MCDHRLVRGRGRRRRHARPECQLPVPRAGQGDDLPSHWFRDEPERNDHRGSACGAGAFESRRHARAMPAGVELVRRAGDDWSRFKAHIEGAPQELGSPPLAASDGAHRFAQSGAEAFEAHSRRNRSSAPAQHASDCQRRSRTVERRFGLSADRADTLGGAPTPSDHLPGERPAERKRAGFGPTREVRYRTRSQRRTRPGRQAGQVGRQADSCGGEPDQGPPPRATSRATVAGSRQRQRPHERSQLARRQPAER
jgi:hypothetical protein